MRSCLLLLALLAAPAFAQEAAPPPAGPAPGPLWPTDLGPLPATAPPAPLPSLSAQTCNACHGLVHDQWAVSGHARAATNPHYLAAREAQGQPAVCDECHRPMLQQRPTLPKGPGPGSAQPNPAWEPSLGLEGVTCAACHVRDGVVVGPRDLDPEDVPHAVRAEPALRTPEACAFCHQAALPGAEDHPFLDTVGEWKRSVFGEVGVACQECHMSRVSGPVAGSRFAAFATHDGLRGRSPEALRRALTLEVDLQSSSVARGQEVRATATLRNTGAAHAVPTGDPSHRLELRTTLLGPDGEQVKGSETASTWFGREVEATFPFATVSDERLQAGSERPVDYRQPLNKKMPEGSYTLLLQVFWWSAAPEALQALQLSEDAHRVLVTEQRHPLAVH